MKRGTCSVCGSNVAYQGKAMSAVGHGRMWECPGSGKPVKEGRGA